MNVSIVCIICYLLNRVRLFVTPWTVAHQVSLFMGFSRQEHSSGLPFLSPRALPNPGIKPGSSALQADSLLSEPSTHIYLRGNRGTKAASVVAQGWRRRFYHWVWKIPWRRKWQPTPVFFPWKFQGQGRLQSTASWKSWTRLETKQ